MNVTFLYGKQDWMDHKHAVKALRDHGDSTHRKVVVIDQAGHHLYLDNPDGFNHALLEDLGHAKGRRDDVVHIDLSPEPST
jgi:cardiolipin-specific phospholipase